MNIEWSTIEKILNKIASEKEQAEFDRWLSENPEQKGYFEKMNDYNNDPEAATMKNSMQRLSRHSADNILARNKSRKGLRLVLTASAVAAAMIAVTMLLFAPKPKVQNHALELQQIAVKEEVTITNDHGEVLGVERLAEDNIEVDTARGELKYVVAKAEEKIEYHTITIPKERDFILTLSDSTKVYLNAGSQLRYPSRFKAGEPRKVSLTGEGYFEVYHKEKEQFIVNVESMNVVVYGTKFNINSYRKEIQTVLVEGSVAIDFGGKQIMLKPNEMATLNKLGGNVVVERIDSEPYTAWTTGYFSFENRPMEKITEVLTQWYGTEIEFRNEKVKNELFSCHVEKSASLDDFLKAISNTGKIKYKKLNDKYLIW